MNKNIISLAAIAALAVGAQAATIVKTATSPVGFTIPGSPLPAGNAPGSGGVAYTIAVPQPTIVETAGVGFLTGIAYEITFGTYATYALTDVAGNLYSIQWGLGPLPSPNAANFLMGTDAASVAFSLSSAGLPALGGSPFPTVPGNSSSTGTAQQVFTTPSTTVAAGDLSSYTTGGTSTFNFVAGTFSSVGGQISQTSPAVFQGATVKVTYTYSDIPEPSTYAAGAVLLAGAGFIARRRMQKA